MVAVAQPGRAPVCGTGGRGFKSRRSPDKKYTRFLDFWYLPEELLKWSVTNNCDSLNNSFIRIEIGSDCMLY